MTIRNMAARLSFPADATPHARQLVARDMVSRGNNFLAGAFLLKQHGGDPYVWRHNFRQGIEILLKGLLLVKDFDSYWPRLRTLGHKLVALADASAAAYGVSPPGGELRGELQHLSEFYERHWLRYASGAAIFVDATSIEYERTLKRIAAIQRLMARHQAISTTSNAT